MPPASDISEVKGAFPAFQSEAFLRSPNTRELPADLRDRIGKFGIRNGCLTTIAPTGTTSLLAGNVSSGIEPMFARSFTRRVLGGDGQSVSVTVEDYAVALNRHLGRTELDEHTLPDVTHLTPDDHIRMQTAAQRHIDSAISKTINCPKDLPFEDFKDVYMKAFDAGLKGCTTYRPNDITGAVLSAEPASSTAQPDAVGPAPNAGEPGPENNYGHSQDAEGDNVHYLTPPHKRPPELRGVTYVRVPAGLSEPLHVTVNDLPINGHRRPYEMLISAPNPQDQAWLNGLARVISALMARGDGAGVADVLRRPHYAMELSAPDATQAQLRVSAILETLVNVLDAHVAQQPTECEGADVGDTPRRVGLADAQQRCPDCGVAAQIRFEGCWVCHRCGAAACG